MAEAAEATSPEGVEEPIGEEDLEMEISEAGTEERVHFMDPDFIIILLFALFVDAMDIILTVLVILGVFTVPLVVSVGFDAFVFSVIAVWMYWRTSRIAKSKKAKMAGLKKALQEGVQKLSRLQKIGKVPDKVFQRYMSRFGQRMGTLGRFTARSARSPFFRVMVRGLLVFLGEAIALVGLIPFWTIMVVLILREK